MKTSTIWLIVLLALVIASIVYLQKPAQNVERVAPAVQKIGGVPAPELAGIDGYINTDNITISSLIGKKVILIDFWTYSCINCQRTLPYVTMWYDKYKDKGLEIIGVHSPEFDFEKKYDNVKRATEKWGIKYPVVLDNEHATWDAFMNRYWPRKYLIDIDGYVVWDHAGEGNYDEAERKIQELLKERMTKLGMKDGVPTEVSEVKAPEVEFGKIGSPEIYLGYEFTRGNFGNGEGLPANEEVAYTLPSKLSFNNVYLDGKWFVDKDNVRLVSDTGKVVLKYSAKNVNIVASADPGSELSVKVDDEVISKQKVAAEDLYSLLDSKYGSHTLSFDVNGSGFKLYTFTFG
jgi:thiol-disulfide isomerase/thioredoxin